jgi:glyoxalase-like protein
VLTEGMYIDHVIYGVMDVDAAAERLRREHGLGSVPGGIHLGGTTDRIVPLAPPTFLELLGVGDPALADGAWLSQTLAGRDRPIWWAIGVDDLAETARRRGLPLQAGTMEMPDGSRPTFRTAGMPRYPLPFFIASDGDPGARMRHWEARYREAGHECEPGAFTFVEVGDTPELLDAWLGDHGLPVRHAPAMRAGVHAVGIQTARGEVVIR